ncbi:MFS transporter [Helicobacter pametensis]|uniref:MFS transporter n=1 Tax=Helicobacter pametensis TaxID=95149 RepID=UPI0004B83447|nr:MFS transporter [Helicobacter pametensis]
MRQILKTLGFKTFLGVIFIGSFIELGHKILILSSIYQIFEGNQRFLLGIFQNILILLPAILLFYPASFFADQYNRLKMLRFSAWFSLTLSSMLLICYSLGAFWPAFFITFLLAIQNALFFPSKLGYLRDLIQTHNLAQANAIAQAITIAAMLAGLFISGSVFKLFTLETHNLSEILEASNLMGILFVFLAIVQIFLSHTLPQINQHTPNISQSSSSYLTHFKNLMLHAPVANPILASALFWGIAQLCITLFPYYVQTQNVHYLSLIALTLGGGAICGAYFTFLLTKNYLELGVIPFGFFFISFSLALFTFDPSPTTSLFLAFALGLGCMLVFTPFLSSILRESSNLGQSLALYQLFQALGMMISLLLSASLIYGNFDASIGFLIACVLSIAGMIYFLKKQPFILTRLLLTFAFNQRYRLIVENFSNIPQNQGVLLIGNHMSFIDWAIVQMAIPQRVYFALEHTIQSKWYVKLFLKHFSMIPHSSNGELLQKMNTLLSQKQIVCFFPEGAVSTHGHLNEFKHDFSLALNDDTLIIPFYIRGLWGSSFSRSNESFKARNHSFLNKRNIAIAFGKALPSHTPKEKIKNAIFDLSFVAWASQCQAMSTIGRTWIGIAKSHLFQTSIIDPINGKFSFGKVLGLSLLLSRMLRETSKNKSDEGFTPTQECIGILLPASFASSLCNLSIFIASKVAINLNFTAGSKAINLAIQSAKIKRILTSKTFMDKLKEKGIHLELNDVELLYMEEIVQKFKSQKLKLLSYLTMAFVLPSFILKQLFSPERNTQAIACILFSSGSEGNPKGVMLNHQNIMSNIAQISDVLCVQDHDSILSSLPPFHAFGLTATTLLPLLSGIPSITYPDPTDALGIAQTIAKHQVSIMCGTSTFLGIYARHPKVDRLMFASLRIVVSGAEKLKSETRMAFENKFQCVILEGYGTTETTPVVSVNLPCKFDALNEEIHQANKIGSVGMPLPGTTLKIVDPSTMEELPHRHEGLVLVGGHQVMVGYLNDPQKTHEVIVEFNHMRWYKTGDKGYLDEDGFLYIIDRYSRFAKIGGEMVSLGGIEEEITQMITKANLIHECKCVAVALEDGKKGEIIALLIQTPKDEEYLHVIQLIKHSSLPAISKPRHYFKVDSIPLLGSGKLDLKGAKDLAKSLLQNTSSNT